MTVKRLSNRRDFLKTAAVGAAGITAAKFDPIFARTSAWTSGMQINPAIDNKRVICCHDTKMLTSTPANTNWTNQNNAVNANVVASNMDEMAKLLAKKTTAVDAWSAIFRSGKPWASTKVAIKTNAIQGSTGNHPKVAIIKKLCDVFVDQFKVPASNIVLYDANSDAVPIYSTYASLTDAAKIRATVSTRAQSLGGFQAVTVAPATKPITCVADLVNGTIDILMNICVCKIHTGPGTSYGFGGISLCTKGHLGTFINVGTESGSEGSATGLHTVEAVCEINKHDAIIGGTPPRQQLCIVDSLLANGINAPGIWNTRTDRIVMGTFAPIVDYLTAMRIIKDVIGAPDRSTIISKYLTNFGYAETDALDWVEFVPGTGIVNPPSREYSGRIVKVILSHPSYKRTGVQFIIPHTAGDMKLRIVDGRGTLVKTLNVSFDGTIVWDGLSNNGTTVSAGNYLIEIAAGGMKRTGNIIVAH